MQQISTHGYQPNELNDTINQATSLHLSSIEINSQALSKPSIHTSSKNKDRFLPDSEEDSTDTDTIIERIMADEETYDEYDTFWQPPTHHSDPKIAKSRKLGQKYIGNFGRNQTKTPANTVECYDLAGNTDGKCKKNGKQKTKADENANKNIADGQKKHRETPGKRGGVAQSSIGDNKMLTSSPRSTHIGKSSTIFQSPTHATSSLPYNTQDTQAEGEDLSWLSEED
jgi:hypothetical protein